MSVIRHKAFLNDDKVWSFLGTFSLAIILVVIGNVSLYNHLSLEKEVITYSLAAYVAINWGGLTEFYLTKQTRKACISKYLFDYITLGLILIPLIYVADTSVITFFSSALLILYPAFTIFYHLRSKGKFKEAAAYGVTLHLALLAPLFFLPMYIHLLLVFGLAIFVMGLLYGLLNSHQISHKNIDLNFHKLGLINTFTGEVDRYIIAAAMAPSISVTYMTITSTLGCITMACASFVRLYVNQFGQSGTLPKIKPYLILQISLLPFVVAILPLLGHEFFVVVVLSLGLLIKYLSVIITMPIFIEMYYAKRSKELFRLSLLINSTSIALSSLYLLLPPTALITAIAKIGSAMPLYILALRRA